MGKGVHLKVEKVLAYAYLSLSEGAFLSYADIKGGLNMDMYQYEKVMTFVDEEDVKFIRLAFFDAFGVQKYFYHVRSAGAGL